MNALFDLYRFVFARPVFEKFNRLVVLLGLRGLGVLNFRDSDVSGERHFLKTLLSASVAPTCIDVGANRGTYAKLVLECCPTARLFCFEPHPKTFAVLQTTLLNNRSARLENSGCGAANGELLLFDYLNEDGSSHASLHQAVIERIHRSASVSHIVPIVCLDDYVEANGVDVVDLLKIDTEGHEYAVLRGAQRSIRAGRVKCIHFEFNEMNAMSHVLFRDIFDFLSNYRLYRLLPHGMIEIREYSPLFCEIFAFQNIVGYLRQPTAN